MRGLEFFSQEANLNHLSAAELRRIAAEAGLENFKVKSAKLAGWPSNLLLSAYRDR